MSDSFLLQENEIREIRKIDSKKSMIDTAKMQGKCEMKLNAALILPEA